MSESSTTTTSTASSAPLMPDPPLVILATMAQLRQEGWNILTVQQFRDFLFETSKDSQRYIEDESPKIAHEAVLYSETVSEESHLQSFEGSHEDVCEIQDPAIEQQIDRRLIESPIPSNYSSFTPTNFFNDDLSSQSSHMSRSYYSNPAYFSESSNMTPPIQNIFGTPMLEDL